MENSRDLSSRSNTKLRGYQREQVALPKIEEYRLCRAPGPSPSEGTSYILADPAEGGPGYIRLSMSEWALDMYNVVYHLGPAQLKGHSISGPSLAEWALDISWCKASGPSLIKGISYIWAEPS